jgi:hypothetical protein
LGVTPFFRLPLFNDAVFIIRLQLSMPFLFLGFFLLFALGNLVADPLVDVIPYLLVVIGVFAPTAAAVATHIENVFEPVGYFLNDWFVSSN